MVLCNVGHLVSSAIFLGRSDGSSPISIYKSSGLSLKSQLVEFSIIFINVTFNISGCLSNAAISIIFATTVSPRNSTPLLTYFVTVN